MAYQQTVEENRQVGQTNNNSGANNKPIRTFTAKGGVSATVWENVSVKDGKSSTYPSVNIERRYTQDDGATWKTTGSMRMNDLPAVAMVAQKAYEFISLSRRKPEDNKN